MHVTRHMFGVDELHDQKLYDKHMEDLERQEEEAEEIAGARVDRFKNLTLIGKAKMKEVLALTGAPKNPDQAEGWKDALTGEKGEEVAMLFDAAIKFVERSKKRGKSADDDEKVEEDPKAKRAKMLAAAAKEREELPFKL